MSILTGSLRVRRHLSGKLSVPFFVAPVGVWSEISIFVAPSLNFEIDAYLSLIDLENLIVCNVQPFVWAKRRECVTNMNKKKNIEIHCFVNFNLYVHNIIVESVELEILTVMLELCSGVVSDGLSVWVCVRQWRQLWLL